jgi:uncharacterized protein
MNLQKGLRWLGALLLSVFAGQSVAQQTCDDPGSSLLWEVTGPGLGAGKATLHLFGSIHLGKPEFYPLHPTIESTFRAADKLVFEIDPQAVADPQVALRMGLRGMLPAGQTLANVVSPEALESLREILGGYGIPLDNIMTMKPWMLTLLLANVQATSLGYSAQYGLEGYFIAQKAPGTGIEQLETIDQQIDMLDSMDPKLLLDYSLRDFDDSAAEMEALIAAWRCADKEALNEQLFAELLALEETADPAERAGIETMFNKLYTDRN